MQSRTASKQVQVETTPRVVIAKPTRRTPVPSDTVTCWFVTSPPPSKAPRPDQCRWTEDDKVSPTGPLGTLKVYPCRDEGVSLFIYRQDHAFEDSLTFGRYCSYTPDGSHGVDLPRMLAVRADRYLDELKIQLSDSKALPIRTSAMLGQIESVMDGYLATLTRHYAAYLEVLHTISTTYSTMVESITIHDLSWIIYLRHIHHDDLITEVPTSLMTQYIVAYEACVRTFSLLRLEHTDARALFMTGRP